MTWGVSEPGGRCVPVLVGLSKSCNSGLLKVRVVWYPLAVVWGTTERCMFAFMCV